MATHGTGGIERTLRRALVPLFALSGAVVVTAFFFPAIVGDVVSGRVWLFLSLVFFGSGLSYVSLLPLEAEEGEKTDEPDDPRRVLTVRRISRLDTAREFFAGQDPIVFGTSVGGLTAFFGLYLLAPATMATSISVVRNVLLREFGWLFAAPILVSVVFCLYLLVGPWGDIKLGGPDATPGYTYPVYFTMFFTAGIAAGIVFWGPAEALFHYREPPPSMAAEPRSDAAVVGALTYALFHWGFSAWSAYVVVGVPIAYFVYQHGAPLRVSTALAPFLGLEGLDSVWARFVDLLAVLATIGGIATSIALVSQQFLAGIDHQWAVTYGTGGSVLFVTGLTAIFVISARTGVHRGIRRLSAITILLFALVSVVLFVLGPRWFVLEQGAAAVGRYAVTFVPMSVEFGTEWAAGWTVWNWSWWFSWAPFAGLFLAALSKGRRIRTVVLTGFVATSMATMTWFLLLGGTAIQFQRSGRADILGAVEAFGGSEAVAGFPLFQALALGQLLTFLFLALIICFIATSADTSTLVVAILAARHEVAPTTGAVVFWGLFQGVVAVSVLVTGSAQTLQTAAVLTGAPIALVSVVAVVGLTRFCLEHERGHASAFGRLRSVVLERETDD
ncbi:BCCT family transporter [Natrarchaeobius chitinivorans]|uniref:BCCT family transporter n=1 Tax=Natrarchaeobius chitinivorans TaxID=1679083 RepID=A0A3N6MRI4_NATCH|nr:BCCT family transporter [Natrarchaeobius chitinivorans]RQG97276.1 BCCT family transporter [Natrarchaeobius chitinivorans]